ncbi:hypothetical protein SARC_08647 [Sphaeroforma arctica JP610]|uniref:Uncharacterized protein n=1 Tax=Sphaeroforma arctica JP610 TaxID=667725 RepID=A0A0L0FQ62_9EUKA|nr:hypothetical protein SARC_08647 [Sphaeroforma arctica JP610]KNC78940.1 hypothetical protein SARC_08647 [Sphaeroforma arctica JP610]|eukprot:XP_014152842.1 hypothetical protein SARC_08647 [Sphaeroforma arctica JP610]
MKFPGTEVYVTIVYACRSKTKFNARQKPQLARKKYQWKLFFGHIWFHSINTITDDCMQRIVAKEIPKNKEKVVTFVSMKGLVVEFLSRPKRSSTGLCTNIPTGGSDGVEETSRGVLTAGSSTVVARCPAKDDALMAYLKSMDVMLTETQRQWKAQSRCTVEDKKLLLVGLRAV